MQITFSRPALRPSLMVAKILLWRLIQTLVIVPASMFAVFVVVGIVTGHEPVRGVVEAVMDYAENNVRPASEGYVLSVPCTVPDLVSSSDLTSELAVDGPRPLTCDPSKAVEVPIKEVVDDTLKTFARFYSILVLVAGIVVALMYPGRRYVGLKSAI